LNEGSLRVRTKTNSRLAAWNERLVAALTALLLIPVPAYAYTLGTWTSSTSNPANGIAWDTSGSSGLDLFILPKQGNIISGTTLDLNFKALVSGSGTANLVTTNQNFDSIPGISNILGTGGVTVKVGFGDGTTFSQQIPPTFSQTFTNQFTMPSNLPGLYSNASVTDGQFAMVQIEFTGFGTQWGNQTNSSSKIHLSFTSNP
jgi:hypothetical protein